DPEHPIVKGLGDTIEIYDTPLDIDHLSSMDMGNGKAIASVEQTDGTRGAFIAEWVEPGFFIGDRGRQHSAPRLYIGMFRYHEADSNGSFANYTDDGLTLFANIVEYALSLSSHAAGWDIYE